MSFVTINPVISTVKEVSSRDCIGEIGSVSLIGSSRKKIYKVVLQMIHTHQIKHLGSQKKYKKVSLHIKLIQAKLNIYMHI